MAIKHSIFSQLKIVLVSVSCLIALVACNNNDTSVSDWNVEIHAGSPGGPYNKLIELFELRARKLESDCENSTSECSPLSNFSFTSACADGGSLTNLKRLGLKLVSESEEDLGSKFNPMRLVSSFFNSPTEVDENSVVSSPCEDNRPARPQSDNDFALVQNFFVSGAAQSSCPVKTKENGECDLFFANQMNDDYYELFDDLRIALPMYYGRIQFISAYRESSEAQIQQATYPDVATKKVEFTDLAHSGIYLRGVNKIYGDEILQRDPRLDYNELSILEGGPDNLDLFITNLISNEALADEIFEFVDSARVTGESEMGSRMLACGIIRSYVISGEIIEERERNYEGNAVPDRCKGMIKLQQVQIPEIIIDSMVAEYPYYQKLPQPSYWPDNTIGSMPAIITYLITTKNAEPNLVTQLTAALLDDWNNLMMLNNDLTPIEDNILKKPAPFHEGAEETLRAQNLLGGGIVPSWAALFGSVFIFFALWKWEPSYDRLGEREGRARGWINRQFVFDSLRIALILGGWCFGFMVIVNLLQNLEGAQSAVYNVDSEISRFNFFQALLWMFTFISSGYENDVFPNSPWSIFLVSVFAIFGVALPLYFIISQWERMRTRSIARARGGESNSLLKTTIDRLKFTNSKRRDGILLVCGWNSKAPGMIYAMTCKGSPFQGLVNIVADMDVEFPINHWRFSKNKVRFYRGDPTHRSNLRRAEASIATGAVILTNDLSDPAFSNSGVLTALALKRIKEDIFITAEMTPNKADRSFTQQYVHNLIDPRLIARQMMLTACFDHHVLDFVLDVLSPDAHCEWYSYSVSELKDKLPALKSVATVKEFSVVLQQYKITLVGICKNTQDKTDDLFSPNLSDTTHLDPLISYGKSLDRILSEEDYIICAADSPKSFKKGSVKRLLSSEDQQVEITLESTTLSSARPTASKMLIIGHEKHARHIAQYMEENLNNVLTSIVATDLKENASVDYIINSKLKEQGWTHVLLLSSVSESRSSLEHVVHATQADSETILRANLIKLALLDSESPPEIIAEVNSTQSRELAKDAEVTTIVPTSLFVERILARLVLRHDKVPQMLSAMLSMRDDVYLKSVTLTPGHPLVGLTFTKALYTWFKDGRILGILPNTSSRRGFDDDGEEGYRNMSDDFDWHFFMCPNAEVNDQQMKIGDVVIVLSYPEILSN